MVSVCRIDILDNFTARIKLITLYYIYFCQQHVYVDICTCIFTLTLKSMNKSINTQTIFISVYFVLFLSIPYGAQLGTGWWCCTKKRKGTSRQCAAHRICIRTSISFAPSHSLVDCDPLKTGINRPKLPGPDTRSVFDIFFHILLLSSGLLPLPQSYCTLLTSLCESVHYPKLNY